MMQKNIWLAVGLVALASTAMAGGRDPASSSSAAAESTAIATGVSHAEGGTATGGAGGLGGSANASAEGGAGGVATATQTATGGAASQSQNASNAGNAQAVNINHRRSAPSIAQGSIMPSGCGAGGNAGGSREGGAAFLGLGWTTHQCYALMAAASYAAIGMPDVSCDLLNSMASVRKAHKRLGKPLPDCTIAEVPDAAPAVVILDAAAADKRVTPPSRAEVNEAIDRAFKRAVEK